MSLFVSAAPARRWRAVLPAAAAILALGACTAHVAPAAGRTPVAGQPARTLYNLAYARVSPQERLDLYLPRRLDRLAPVVIWIHGGGWQVGDKSSITGFAGPSSSPPQRTNCRDIVEVQVPDLATLTARDYAVAAINYRLDLDPVAAVQDAKAAVRFLRTNATRYHLDPDRFAAWGNSAGGYSALMLGITAGQHTIFDDPRLGDPNVSSAVQAVVDWFGATELSDLPGRHIPAEDPFPYIARARSLPPFRIAHGDADCIVPVQHSRDLQTALRKASAVSTLVILHGAGHEDPAFMRTQSAPTIAFLGQALRQ